MNRFCIVILLAIVGCTDSIGPDSHQDYQLIVWAFDGVRNDALYVVGQNGETPRQISPDSLIARPLFSVAHDGSHVLFTVTSGNGTSADIWAIRRGSPASLQTASYLVPGSYPLLRSDGQGIIITSGRSGAVALWSCDFSGQHLEQLTPDTVHPSLAIPSPTRPWLAFVHFFSNFVSGQVAIFDYQVRAFRVLLPDTLLPATYMSWSPDGQSLTFAHDSDIYIWSSETPLSLLYSGSTFLSSPAWSPDGSMIAFNERDSLKVIHLETGTVRYLANRSTPVFQSAWAPDGSRIAFSLEDRTAIGIVDLQSGRRIDVSIPGRKVASPAWLPIQW